MSPERVGEAVQRPADEHPAVRFAREVRASVVLPSPALHERRMDAQTDVRKVWALYGPEKEF